VKHEGRGEHDDLKTLLKVGEHEIAALLQDGGYDAGAQGRRPEDCYK
jgi:hypothetical protein